MKKNIYYIRSIIKELPRVMMIYDVDIPLKTARTAITFHFRKHSQLQDGRYYIHLVYTKLY